MSRTGTALAVAAGVGGVALNVIARRAPWRHYPWHLVGMAGGILGTELPVPTATAQLAATGVAAALGAGRSKVGAAALALSAGAAVATAALQKPANDSIRQLQGAVDEALGRGAVQLWAPKPALPGRFRRAEFIAADGVEYTDGQRLDVWRKAGVTGAPVLVQVHGGSWTGGDRRQQNLPLLAHLADQGWVCVAIDYRLGPKNRWPAQIVDVKRAIAWVRANIERYGGDPSFIAITGGSAGGHLAGLAALTGNDPAFQPDFEDADTSIQAGALLYGVYDLAALNDDGSTALRDHIRRVMIDDEADLRAASPIHRLGPDSPPLLVLHGDRDEIVSVNQAREFAFRAREVGAPVGYAELPYAHHAFDMLASARTVATAHAVEEFLSYLAKRRG
ncbi:alpha/beta hydrolase [Kutzneria buriramensis]|uniref:Acetyl esterase/lipase n=1 Tax=Kutzneria buriramensis TaxID=1045776 RepID=A0A3E0GYB4_9PSEU|nr:alpha/beta hydrolase [Kutzneria buriramensis]REH35158.1 acetyl esterase/lipase [Kutzneria buriramensis]